MAKRGAAVMQGWRAERMAQSAVCMDRVGVAWHARTRSQQQQHAMPASHEAVLQREPESDALRRDQMWF